jgi:hypothetical protein
MLSSRQIWVLFGVAIGFWLAVAGLIQLVPDYVPGTIGFIIALPMGWLSVWITRRCASLTSEQLPLGVLLVGAIVMMMDGAVLHWVPQLYSSVETTARLIAAWLLWGYGVAFAFAVLMARPQLARE